MKQNLEIENIGETPLLDKKPPKKKLIIIISIIIGALLVIGVIIFVVLMLINKKDDPHPGPEPRPGPDPDPKNEIYLDIHTSENKKIRNSFKEGCENYNETLGNINNGSDYSEPTEIILIYVFHIMQL